MAEQSVTLRDHSGQPFRGGQQLAFMELSVADVVDGIGVIVVDLPGLFDTRLLRDDFLVDVWRRPTGGKNSRLAIGLLRKWAWMIDDDGAESTRLVAFTPNELAVRRIVAYFSHEAEAAKTETADDWMIQVVKENFGVDATDTARRITDYLTVAAEISLGPSITTSVARDQVDRVLPRLQAIARQKGTPTFWRFSYVGDYQFKFETFIGQPGEDHITTGASPVTFSRDFGNLGEHELEYDSSAEVNYIYGGWRGEGGARVVNSEGDEDRIASSPINRREAFRNYNNVADANDTLDLIKGDLWEGRPRRRFKGELLDTPQARFGLDFGLGDRVPVVAFGQVYPSLIRAYELRVDAEGKETFRAHAEVEDVA